MEILLYSQEVFADVDRGQITICAHGDTQIRCITCIQCWPKKKTHMFSLVVSPVKEKTHMLSLEASPVSEVYTYIQGQVNCPRSGI